MSDSCKNCLYSKIDPRDVRILTCRRETPRTALVPNQMGQPVPISFNPMVGGDDWCGEYKRKVALNGVSMDGQTN